MSDKESIEQFLARGGKIEKVEAQETPETKNVMTCASSTHPHLASLANGQILFAEKMKKRKVDKDKKFAEKLDKSSLPQDLIDKLKKAANIEKDGRSEKEN